MILDPQQIAVEKKLAELATKLEQQSSSGFLAKFFAKKNPLKSFYIYGGVGRGKSMLMKNFFDSLHETPKIYFHFNSFMRKIHEALRDIRKEEKKFKDELIEAVKRVSTRQPSFNTHKTRLTTYSLQLTTKILCLDEFQVTDIADAMLLSRIFSYLFSQGVVVVFTSNSHPRELYKNGLQREIFLEFIDEVLLKNCEVLHLDSPTDYRAQFRKGLAQRYFISNTKTREELKKIIENFTDGKKAKITKLKVWGREIKVRKSFSIQQYSQISSKLPECFQFLEQHSQFPKQHPQFPERSRGATKENFHPLDSARGTESVAWGTEGFAWGAEKKEIAIFTFEELCRAEFSASDYQAICQKFDLIFLLKLPSLSAEEPNEARRFTLFIDEIYENKTALIILAKTTPDKIHTHSEAFKRTVSRLKEIESDEYWQGSKINF